MPVENVKYGTVRRSACQSMERNLVCEALHLIDAEEIADCGHAATSHRGISAPLPKRHPAFIDISEASRSTVPDSAALAETEGRRQILGRSYGSHRLRCALSRAFFQKIQTVPARHREPSRNNKPARRFRCAGAH